MTQDTMVVDTQCPFCQAKHAVEVGTLDYIRYNETDMLIQDCFPYLNADERELIKTGICNTCWDTLGE